MAARWKQRMMEGGVVGVVTTLFSLLFLNMQTKNISITCRNVSFSYSKGCNTWVDVTLSCFTNRPLRTVHL